VWTLVAKESSNLGMVQSVEVSIASIVVMDSIVSATSKRGRDEQKLIFERGRTRATRL
jgi:hypothetical protein